MTFERNIEISAEDRIDRVSYKLFELMLLFNGIIIVFNTLVTSHAIYGFVKEGDAFSLITRCQLNIVYWKIPVIAIMLYIGLLLILSVECHNHVELIAKLWMEGMIVCGIVIITGITYNITVLLIFADVMRNRIDWKKKLIYIVGLTVFDLVLSSSLPATYLNITPVSVIWTYYRNDISSALFGAMNMMFLINVFIFILYMVFLTLEQMSEKERIAMLYKELSKANAQLEDANKRLEEYTEESVRAAETRERNRFAQEIHDTLGHALTGIVTGVEACIMLMDIAPEATKEQLKAIEEVARQGITDVRQSVKALRPDALQRLALEDALLKIVDETQRSTGVNIDFECTTSLMNFSQDEEEAIYRIVQESVTNAIRHGKSTKIKIMITRENELLMINIKDNGIGCGKIHKGFGLHHMEERLNLLNGRLEYEGSNGFTINASIPIRWGNSDEDGNIAEVKDND